MNKIIEDLIKIENRYIYENDNNNDLYNDFKDSENILILYTIYEILKNKQKKIFKINLDYLCNEIDQKIRIDYKELHEIKNSRNFIISYISIFIIISLNTNSNKSLSKDDFKLNNISDCCNKVEYLINKLQIFLKIKFGISEIKIKTETITKIFYLMINNNIIEEVNIFNNNNNKTIKFIYIKNMNYVSIKEIYTKNFKCFEYNDDM